MNGPVAIRDTKMLRDVFVDDLDRWTWTGDARVLETALPVYKCPRICGHHYGKCPEPPPVYNCPTICEHGFGGFGPCPRPRRLPRLSKRRMTLDALIISVCPGYPLAAAA